MKIHKGDKTMKLTINKLKEEATSFCKHESSITHNNLIGITDGKAVGTYIEHKFEEHLRNNYEITTGSSSKGIDLPDSHINTDIKVTSIKKPQSSSPFKNIEQKIYGLGHNLLIFVYEKTDMNNNCYLDFKQCIFLEAEKTGDYNLTKVLREMVENREGKSKIIEILKEGNVPGNEDDLESLAEKPIMLDDSCYYLPFDDYDEAYITLLILNSKLVKKFLKNIAFLDSKRPFTKKNTKKNRH